MWGAYVAVFNADATISSETIQSPNILRLPVLGAKVGRATMYPSYTQSPVSMSKLRSDQETTSSSLLVDVIPVG